MALPEKAGIGGPSKRVLLAAQGMIFKGTGGMNCPCHLFLPSHCKTSEAWFMEPGVLRPALLHNADSCTLICKVSLCSVANCLSVALEWEAS